MKISGQQLQQIINNYQQYTKKPNTAGSGPAAPQDQVNVSQRASDILMARQAYDRLPDVRADRVAEIQQKLQSSTYQINAAEVARLMVLEVAQDGLP